MGRQALVTLDHVRTAAAALRAEGRNVSSRAVREKLGNFGSMGTINKLLQQCIGEKNETPDSLRQLPAELHRAVLAFTDQQADAARTEIADELIRCRHEMTELAEENDRLMTTIEDLREQLLHARSEKAIIEGRVGQLMAELTDARAETASERRAAETARIESIKLGLRIEALVPLEEELRSAREQGESQRNAFVRSGQAIATLEAQRLALDKEVHNLKSDLSGTRAANEKLDKKIETISALLDKERESRVLAERELAVAYAMQTTRQAAGKNGRKPKDQQATP
jgi:chromosome segregation ATPase